jgi:hypothetical protein
MLIVEVAGLEVQIFYTSLQISETANGRNTAAFLLQSISGGDIYYDPQVGQSVRIRWDSTVIFAGTVDSIDVDNPSGTELVEWNVQCVDYNQLADRRIVASAYDNATFQEIVTDLLTNFLALEGVQAGTIPTGPTLTRVVFAYQSVADCFNDLANLTGYTWNIDYFKLLQFCPLDTFPASLNVAQQNGFYRNPKLHRSRDQYKNSVILSGGQDTSQSRTEDFVGDGTNRNFTVSLPIAKEPTLTVNGSPRTVGIKGVDTGFDFYWSQSDPIIEQDGGDPALASTDTFEVTYQGYFPIVMQLEDGAQIAERAAIEGGTGRYESVDNDTSIDSSALAIDKIQGTLRRFAFVPTQFTFETDTSLTNLAADYRAGQTVFVDFPIWALAETFFIQDLSTSFDGVRLIVTAKCIDAEKAQSWADFFAELFAAGKNTELRDGLALSVIRTLSGDEAIIADSLSVSSGGISSLIGSSVLSFSEVAA